MSQKTKPVGPHPDQVRREEIWLKGLPLVILAVGISIATIILASKGISMFPGLPVLKLMGI